MNNKLSTNPARRQVLVNLGNRFVVFGPDHGLPEPIRFDPQDSPILPRVADESEGTEVRIMETLQVSGMTRENSNPATRSTADIELLGPDGNRILIDVKVREGDPKRRDFEAGTERLRLAKAEGQNLEIWFFNIERPKLTVMRFDSFSHLQLDDLVPLNVWERTAEGVFERQSVVEEVEDWLHRVERIYADVREWLADRADLRFEQTRTVTMSEELMQKYAVTDRELQVLDVLRGDQVIASFVPRGLWLIGSWGRIDIITKEGTAVLVAIKQPDRYEWKLVFPNDRRRLKPFDKPVLLELMSGQ
jgi:hypothetical protein